MCGITGVFLQDRERTVDEAVLIAMRDCMAHRGPDDAGLYRDGPLGFGHRRLSIVGLSTGHQPMSDAQGRLVIVFNGEIYNYLPLKKELQQKGYQFRTESDTEVIIALYAEYGKDCVHRLNGMFVFAIWDVQQRELFMARDRLGIKPLYIARTDDAFLFASEIKSLLAYPGLAARCNNDALYEYFLFRAVSGEQTLFAGVRSLLPGHRLTASADKMTIEQYWHHRRQPVDYSISAGAATERLEALLDDAVRIRLMSEVPLGTFCSGGVDSSLVTALAARAIGEPVNTFSVGFHEPGFDEGEYARLVAKQYGTIHHELKVDGREFAALLPELVRLNDEPLNFANSVHIFAISRLAKQFVTVVLTGEGADELFLGYPRYQIPRLAGMLRRLSLLLRPLLQTASFVTRDHRLKTLVSALRRDPRLVMLHNSATNQAAEVEMLLPAAIPRALAYRERVLDECADCDHVLSRMSVQDQQTYLVSILNRQDKMSMGASVEARVPFLDYRIVEFANALPTAIKMRGLQTKLLVKQVAGNYLPPEVVKRRKSGFGVPLAAWFRDTDGLGGLAVDLIQEGGAADYLDHKHALALVRRHQSGAANHAELLWTIVNFLLWKQHYRI